jgi:hypothetical protein
MRRSPQGGVAYYRKGDMERGILNALLDAEVVATTQVNM